MIFYCGERGHIFAVVASLMIVLHVPYAFIYMNELTFGFVFMNLALIVVLFFAYCVLAMVLVYIFRLHSQLDESNDENVKLLNGMHEGVLIFNRQDTGSDSSSVNSRDGDGHNDGEKSKNNVLFWNRPARKLFRKFISNSDKSEKHFT